VPLEISKDIALKHGIEIKDEDFENFMEEQRQRSRNGTHMASEIFSKGIGHLLTGINSQFVGYEKLESEGRVLAILQQDVLADQAQQGAQVDIVLDTTPFYAEAGGQVGDTGYMLGQDGSELEVLSTIKVDNSILHRCNVRKGQVKKGDCLKACVTTEKRLATARNHTATHLLQYALREILGDHVEQSGSYVDEKKLRFDFTHLKALQKETLDKIEKIVNQSIWQNLMVKTDVMDIDKAKKSGALAFFGEKYADTVRVLSIADISKEFCGGTHVERTGQIGLFKIVSESSIAQGIRRIEAITGSEAFAYVKYNEKIISNLEDILKTPSDQLADSALKLTKQLKTFEKQLVTLKMGSLSNEVDIILKSAIKINGFNLINKQFSDYDVNSLRKMNDQLKIKADPVICVLATTMNSKPMFLVGVSPALIKQGIDAVRIIKELSAVAGGGGGGKKDLAQAGAKDKNSLKNAIEQAPEIIKNLLKK
jgi:alanyl-tRNA synthetase